MQRAQAAVTGGLFADEACAVQLPAAMGYPTGASIVRDSSANVSDQPSPDIHCRHVDDCSCPTPALHIPRNKSSTIAFTAFICGADCLAKFGAPGFKAANFSV